MQAVILAGGKGSRLRPLTFSLPKPLVPVGEYPIIEVILRQLHHYGFNDVVVSTGHLAALIQAYCGDGRRWGLKIRYVLENEPLSTAGALKLVRRLAPQFMTINGDLLTTLDYGKLFGHHRRQGTIGTVAVCERKTTVDFGVISLDGKNRISGYSEKPRYNYLVSMGVNVFDRRAVKEIRPGERIGIPELIDRLRDKGHAVSGFKSSAEWLDIGRPDDYQTAQDLFSHPRTRSRYIK